MNEKKTSIEPPTFASWNLSTTSKVPPHVSPHSFTLCRTLPSLLGGWLLCQNRETWSENSWGGCSKNATSLPVKRSVDKTVFEKKVVLAPFWINQKTRHRWGPFNGFDCLFEKLFVLKVERQFWGQKWGHRYYLMAVLLINKGVKDSRGGEVKQIVEKSNR